MSRSMLSDAYIKRNHAIVSRLLAGESGTVISKDEGITRQRVYQIGRENGISLRPYQRARRRVELQAKAEARQQRREAARNARKALLVEQLKAFYEKTGRSPTMRELGAVTGHPRQPNLPSASSLGACFGSIMAAFAAAGIPSRPAGGRGHL